MTDRTTGVSASQALALAAVSARRDGLPRGALHSTKRAVIDWLAVAIAAADSHIVAALVESACAGDGPCRVVGRSERTTMPTAALINGTAAHTLELDDIYAPGFFHPGAPVIAAALAAAERRGASGTTLLSGIALGYEVGNRIASDLGPRHYERFHTTGTVGAIAAAAAAGTVLCLDEPELTSALGLAATMAAGLQQTLRSASAAKPLHAGHAAQAGSIAALAAQRGVVGAPDALDGEIGLGVTMGDGPSWDHARHRFGPEFLIEKTTVKTYPCCGHTFAAIDAARQLHGTGIQVKDVSAITVETYAQAARIAGIVEPRTSEEAKFSLAFTVAAALRDGSVGLASFDPRRLTDSALKDLSARVTVRDSPEFSLRAPTERGARVDVTLHSGESVSATVPDRSGSPSNPVSDRQLEQKFLSLTGRRAGHEHARRLLGDLCRLEELPNVRDLPLTAGHA